MIRPRVTEILGPFADFSKVPPEVLEAACERGTAVHKACESYALGLYCPTPPHLTGYFDSFRRWFDSFVVEVLAVEAELTNPAWGYIGHADIIARLKGVRPSPVVGVIDYKTPFSESRSWHCQTQAYVEAARNKYGAEIGGALRLRKDGSLPIMTWVENPTQAFNAFVGILSGWNFLKGGRG